MTSLYFLSQNPTTQGINGDQAKVRIRGVITFWIKMNGTWRNTGLLEPITETETGWRWMVEHDKTGFVDGYYGDTLDAVNALENWEKQLGSSCCLKSVNWDDCVPIPDCMLLRQLVV